MSVGYFVTFALLLDRLIQKTN